MPPPRPPITTLVIHTWKEHGKPRPWKSSTATTSTTSSIYNEDASAQTSQATDRIAQPRANQSNIYATCSTNFIKTSAVLRGSASPSVLPLSNNLARGTPSLVMQQLADVRASSTVLASNVSTTCTHLRVRTVAHAVVHGPPTGLLVHCYNIQPQPINGIKFGLCCST